MVLVSLLFTKHQITMTETQFQLQPNQTQPLRRLCHAFDSPWKKVGRITEMALRFDCNLLPLDSLGLTTSLGNLALRFD